MFKIGDKVRLIGHDYIGIVTAVDETHINVTWIDGMRGWYSGRHDWFEAT